MSMPFRDDLITRELPDLAVTNIHRTQGYANVKRTGKRAKASKSLVEVARAINLLAEANTQLLAMIFDDQKANRDNAEVLARDLLLGAIEKLQAITE